METKKPGSLMASEVAEAPQVFAQAVIADHAEALRASAIEKLEAIYTIARGSSDAVANILSYEAMRVLNIPVTSLPPSAFSIFGGVSLRNTAALVISQSGASSDLIAATKGAKASGAQVVSITNKPGSAIEQAADLALPVNAGPELAVPATKTVIGSIAVGMALLGALSPEYREKCTNAATAMLGVADHAVPWVDELRAAFLRAQHVYVIGRGAGFGAAHEIALKVKETCALHAEAYSASEVLHGPLQLATKPILVLILDTGEDEVQESLNLAEERFRQTRGDVIRIRVNAFLAEPVCPAAAAAILLYLVYPVILSTALALGHDPDQPETLAKETLTT